MRDPRRLAAELLGRLDVTDPGRLRLRKAWAAALAVTIAIAAMGVAAAALGTGAAEANQLFVVSGFMAMQAAVMVKDRTIRERNVTTALLFAPAMLGASIAAVLSAHWLSEDVGFVAAVFVAVWVRRYGPRGTAYGMIGFFAYFFTLLTHGKLDSLGMIALAIGLGVGSALLVRLLLVRERPRAQLLQLAPALRAASRGVLDAACAADRSSPAELRKRLGELADTAMAIEDWQSLYDADRHVDVSAEVLAERVFEAQLSMEQAASALWALDPDEPWPAALAEAVAALRALLENTGTQATWGEALARAEAAAASGAPGQHGVALAEVRNAARAQESIHRVGVRQGGEAQPAVARPTESRPTESRPTESRPTESRPTESRPTESRPTEPRPSEAGAAAGAGAESGAGAGAGSGVGAGAGAAKPVGPPAPRPGWREWRDWNPATRAAIQCTVAAAIATVLGDLVSADRWYWAVLTSFMVFYGATSRGEILSRAWLRVLGTVLGVGVGLVVVFVIGHRPPVQLALMVVCVFLSVYLGPRSYAVRTFFITVLLASVYDLIGVLNLQVLEWRVEETLLGAAVGIGCAFFLLSTRSSPLLVQRISAYLRQLDTLVDCCANAVLDPRGDHPVVSAARELDSALKAVGAAAKPVASVGSPTHRRNARRWSRQLQMNSRAARVLAAAGLRAQEGLAEHHLPTETEAAFRRAAEYVRGNVAAVAGQFDGEGAAGPDLDTETTVLDVLLTLPPATVETVDAALPAAVRGLSRVNRTLPVYAG